MIKKTFLLEDLDCANCARKVQDKVSKLDGVKSCQVTFLTQKLVYEVEEDKAETVEKEMRDFVKHAIPDVTVKAL